MPLLGPSAAHATQALNFGSGTLLSDELTPEWAEEARNHHTAAVPAAQIRAAEIAAGLGQGHEAVDGDNSDMSAGYGSRDWAHREAAEGPAK